MANRKTTQRPKARRNGDHTRARILEVAIDEFVRHGYSGTRVERIVARARCNMRMLYHHFGSKEALYVAALETVYADIRDKENAIDLRSLEPAAGVRKLVEFTFGHFAEHPNFVELTRNENLLQGRYIAGSRKISAMSTPLLGGIADLLKRGEARGIFRRGINPLQLYVSIVALACHHITNRHTLSATFRTDITTANWLKKRSVHVREMILAYVVRPRRA
jgi:TetR/AcrR family transcriptional regulator